MKPKDDLPSPSFAYQGARQFLVQGALHVGPFVLPGYSGLGFGMNVAESHERGSDVRDFELRPAKRQGKLQDPCTSEFVMFYEQKGVAWDMIFRITTDLKGGVKGTSFAMDVESNYPQIYMSIPKVTVNQGGFGVLMQGDLPADYIAQMNVKFWDNGLTDLPLDSWMALEVAYVKPEARGRKHARVEDVPMVPIGRTTFFPAHQESKGGVLGDNYPR